MKKLSLALLLICLCLILGAFTSCGSKDEIDGEFTHEGGIYEPANSGRSNVLVLKGVCEGVTSLTIPEKIKGYDVEAIKSYAFKGNTTLESLVFNSKVSERFDSGALIEEGAFEGCTALKSVTINGVVRIGKNAFKDCTALESFTATDSTRIDGEKYNIFSYESNNIKVLNVNAKLLDTGDNGNVILPSKTEALTLTATNGYPVGGAFSLENLKSLTLNKVAIGSLTFKNCPLLETISLPSNINTLPTFINCPSLTEVTLPTGIQRINSTIFLDCPNVVINISSLEDLFSIEYDGSMNGLATLSGSDEASKSYSVKLKLNGELINNLVIPASVTKIPRYLFARCDSISSVALHNGITEIGEGAFYHCDNISQLVIPNSITKIGRNAFSDCSLNKVVLGSGVSEIGNNAFANNKIAEIYNLSTLSITKGSSSHGNIGIGAIAIYTSLDAPSVLGNEGDFLFYTENGNHYLYGYAGNAKELTLPASYKGESYKIKDNAFSGAKILSVTIPKGVLSIGKNAFAQPAVIAIYIQDESVEFDYASFSNASYIKEIYYPNYSVLSNKLSSYSYFRYINLYGKDGASIVTISNNYAFITKDGFNYLVAFLSDEGSATLPANCNGESYIISNSAFDFSKNLTNIEIPDNSVYEIEKGAFSLLNLNYTTYKNGKYISNWLIEYVIDESYNHEFELMDGTVGIAQSAVQIKDLDSYNQSDPSQAVALLNMVITNSVKLSSTLKYLGSDWCTYLLVNGGVNLTLPNNLAYIGNFSIPSSMPIELPSSVKCIRENGLTNRTILGTFTITADMKLSSLNAYFDEIIIGDNVVLPHNLGILDVNKITLGKNVTIEKHSYAIDICVFGKIENASLYAQSIDDYLSFIETCNTSYDNPVYRGASLLINGQPLTGALILSEGITKIPSYAFYGLDITSIVIPNSVKVIESEAFTGCDKLNEVTIGTGLKKNNSYFPACVTRLNIPSVEAWLSCKREYSLQGPTDIYVNNERLTVATIPDGITELQSHAFYYWNVEKVILPDSLTAIEAYSLYSDTIKEIEGGLNVESIGYSAYVYGTTIKGSVYGNIRYSFNEPIGPVSKDITWAKLKAGTEYDSCFFADCSKLVFVYVPVGCTLGDNVFCDVGKSFTVMFEDSAVSGSAWSTVISNNKSYRLGTYYDDIQSTYGSVKTYVKLADDFTYTTNDNKAYITGYFGTSTEITIPEKLAGYDVTVIDALAFNYRSDIKSINLNKVTTINTRAFDGCTGLESIDCGDVTTIDAGAFANCTSLAEIVLSENISNIGLGAFSGCTNLVSVQLPATSQWEIWTIDSSLGRWVITVFTPSDNATTATALKETYFEYFWSRL